MAHTYTNLLSHIVFSTKDREPFIDAELKPRLFAYMGGIVRKLNAFALIINGPEDHVHILVSLPATHAPADVVEKVKANSSRWVHQEFSDRSRFRWQTAYSAFSVSQSQREVVNNYIAKQEEHHARLTFREELIAMLTKHGIQYDERYLFE